MNDSQALAFLIESNYIDLAVAGWLDAHSRSAKTLKAYTDTIKQFRARRDRSYARRHRLGGSGATTHYVVPRRIRSVRFYRQVGNCDGVGK